LGGSGRDTARPDWYVPFTVCGTGPCTAPASASGASSISTTFNVSNSCLVTLDPPEPEEVPAPPGPPKPDEKVPKKWNIKIKGKCPNVVTVLQAHLEKVNGPKLDTLPLTPNGGNYNDKFKKVAAGLYVVSIDLVAGNTTVKTSRMVKLG
jgi:hypothetical protein